MSNVTDLHGYPYAQQLANAKRNPRTLVLMQDSLYANYAIYYDDAIPHIHPSEELTQGWVIVDLTQKDVCILREIALVDDGAARMSDDDIKAYDAEAGVELIDADDYYHCFRGDCLYRSNQGEVDQLFAIFQASGKSTDNIPDGISADMYGVGGRLYMDDGYYIEDTATWNPEERSRFYKTGGESRLFGRWYTTILRSEYDSDDLASIERHLFDFCLSEGVMDNERKKLRGENSEKRTPVLGM